MSKSTSPRATKHDWAALLEAAQSADRPLTPQEQDLWQRGVIDGNARAWAADYVRAAQRALEGRNATELIKMLDAAIPLPAYLGPVVADVIRAAAQGVVVGRPAALTAADKQAIREWHQLLSENGMTPKQAIEFIATARRVSTMTVRRSLKPSEP